MELLESKEYVDYAAKVAYSKLPQSLRNATGFDDIQSTAWLAWYTLEDMCSERNRDPAWLKRSTLWKTLELLRSQLITDGRARDTERRVMATFTDLSKNQGDDRDESPDVLGLQNYFDNAEGRANYRDANDALNSVETLTDMERTVLRMIYIAGIPYHEVERQLDMSGYRMQKVRRSGRIKVREYLCCG